MPVYLPFRLPALPVLLAVYLTAHLLIIHIPKENASFAVNSVDI